SKANVSIGLAYAQSNADQPGTFTLIVQGTVGGDHIRISQDPSGRVRAELDGPGAHVDQLFSDISRIEVYGLGGDDHVPIDNDGTVPALVFGGEGDDVLQAGGGSAVLVGGAGQDQISGGLAANILIGGQEADTLKAGSAGDILIAGFTNFDANQAALKAIQAEWTRTDASYAQRIADLSAGGGNNGAYVLNNATVHDDGSRDSLIGGAALDWFFAHLFNPHKDDLSGIDLGETITNI